MLTELLTFTGLFSRRRERRDRGAVRLAADELEGRCLPTVVIPGVTDYSQFYPFLHDPPGGVPGLADKVADPFVVYAGPNGKPDLTDAEKVEISRQWRLESPDVVAATLTTHAVFQVAQRPGIVVTNGAPVVFLTDGTSMSDCPLVVALSPPGHVLEVAGITLGGPQVVIKAESVFPDQGRPWGSLTYELGNFVASYGNANWPGAADWQPIKFALLDGSPPAIHDPQAAFWQQFARWESFAYLRAQWVAGVPLDVPAAAAYFTDLYAGLGYTLPALNVSTGQL